MLSIKRKQNILKHLEQEGIIKLTELVSELKASESTIRRDLDEMEAEGLLERVHGGAKLKNNYNLEPSMQEKSFENIQKKKKIAKYSAELIKKNDCIYLDAGSTTLQIIPFLANKQITVVTNGLDHIEKLVHLEMNAYLLGGKLKGHTKAIVGAVALDNIQNYRFNKVFLGANAISPDLGYTTPDIEEAYLKRAAKNLASEVYVLADHSKFTKIAFAKMFSLKEAILITDYVHGEFVRSFKQKTKIIEVEK